MAKKYVTVALAALMMNLSVLASTPLSRGTALSVRIVSQVTSKEEGSPSAIVENDVKSADGKVLIKRGTPVQLQIDRQKARGCGKTGVGCREMRFDKRCRRAEHHAGRQRER